jgi:tRNA(Ile)-lysidine synthase
MKQVHLFQRRVQNYIYQKQLIARNDSILVAVSGGPDSVALLHVLASLREPCGISKLAVLHFDHQLRAEASAADRAFVETLAESFGFSFHAASEDVCRYRHRHRISLEMAARACRHRFFKDALKQFEAGAIALGHTANDRAEEMLLRLFRGAGPSGMLGMRARTGGGIIRPLLFATRRDILAYLSDQKLDFREDLSNQDLAHQRNALRHKIFPLVEKHFHPRVVEVLCRHGHLVEDEESCWKDLLATHWPAVCIAETSSRMVLSGQVVRDLHPALRRRLLRLALKRLRGNLLGIYAVHTESLYNLLARRVPGTSVYLPDKMWAALDGEFLILSREPLGASSPADQDFSQAMTGPGRYQFTSFDLCLSCKESSFPADAGPFSRIPDTVWLDADKILWPLCLRFWRDGDRFCPLGLGGSKKVQNFFVDSKIPRRERSCIPLLCDQEKICWVMSYRLDDRVKVTPQTEHILIIEKHNTT